MDAPDKGALCGPGMKEQEGTRFHHGLQIGVQFKTHELFISGLFYLIFPDCS